MSNYKEMVTKDELSNILGIEDCYESIKSYIKYIDYSKTNLSNVNYNVIIESKSSDLNESQIPLINVIKKKLKMAGIIKKSHTLTIKEVSELENSSNFNVDGDLIILNFDTLRQNSFDFLSSLKEIFNNNPNKVFILCLRYEHSNKACIELKEYFDWYFLIKRTSTDEKKKYLINQMKKRSIRFDDNVSFDDRLINYEIYGIKYKITELYLKCKIDGIKSVSQKLFDEIFATKKDHLTNKDKLSFGMEICKEDLVGLDGVIGKITKTINYTKLCNDKNINKPMLHMVFKGNPGTGKTTVARLVGKMFREAGILQSDNFVEIHARDLIGEYVGQTAPKTEEYIALAENGILFLDEAYSLNGRYKGSYEDEAIATLIKAMEDKRDRLCVILAGYNNEMDELIRRNPGFESRIQWFINFPDYDVEDLMKILDNMMNREKYTISSKAKNKLYQYIESKHNEDNFSNGRFIRNIFEKIKIEQATRIMGDGADKSLITTEDVAKVIDEDYVVERKELIGFHI